jgi:uncharacterized protein
MSGSVQAIEIVRSGYEAFGRGDFPAILELLAGDFEWKFCGSKGLPYTGTFRTRDEMARWFASIGEVEDIQVFEPREFITAGENVTVLGWERTQAKFGGRLFETCLPFARGESCGSGACTTPRLPPPPGHSDRGLPPSAKVPRETDSGPAG